MFRSGLPTHLLLVAVVCLHTTSRKATSSFSDDFESGIDSAKWFLA